MKPKFYNGNTLQLPNNGAAYFPALEEAIESAQHTISLETYISLLMIWRVGA